jgi:hypothetical protein
MIFAQAGGGAFGLGGQELILLGILAGVLLPTFIATICFLLTLQKCLKRIHPRNRTMQPAMVWLNLVPCLNLVWGFITVIRIAESLDNEFYDQGKEKWGDDYGKSIGITYMVAILVTNVPYVGCLALPLWLVFWVMYWVRIAEYSRQLRDMGGDEYEDFEDHGE